MNVTDWFFVGVITFLCIPTSAYVVAEPIQLPTTIAFGILTLACWLMAAHKMSQDSL